MLKQLDNYILFIMLLLNMVATKTNQTSKDAFNSKLDYNIHFIQYVLKVISVFLIKKHMLKANLVIDKSILDVYIRSSNCIVIYQILITPY